MNMRRRDFLARSLAAATTSLFNTESAWAVSRHPLSMLTDIRTKSSYQTDPNTFDFVLFMTAQEQEADCGGAFVGMHQIMQNPVYRDAIQPVLVMPKLSLQPDPDAIANLTRATKSYGDLDFKILTGELLDLRAISNYYGGVFDIEDGKIVGHTLDGFLLKKESGEQLVRHIASDYYTYDDLLGRIIEGCRAPEKEHLCIG